MLNDHWIEKLWLLGAREGFLPEEGVELQGQQQEAGPGLLDQGRLALNTALQDSKQKNKKNHFVSSKRLQSWKQTFQICTLEHQPKKLKTEASVHVGTDIYDFL